MTGQELVILRGYPGSGKTTWATEWVAEDPEGRARLSRDDLRDAFYDRRSGLSSSQEGAITKAHRAAVKALLAGGKSVAVDDTNLRLRTAREWVDLAISGGASWRVVNVETPVGECHERNVARALHGEAAVPGGVINSFAQRYPMPWPEVKPSERKRASDPMPYTREDGAGLPLAIIVDIDGTLAHMNGRGPYDLDRVHEDTVDPVVDMLIEKMWLDEVSVIFLSGREDSCAAVTNSWLADAGWDSRETEGVVGPLMRKTGDRRPDFEVKYDLFNEHVRGRYDVIFALDDRNQVVRLWRDMGIKCLQVQDGDF